MHNIAVGTSYSVPGLNAKVTETCLDHEDLETRSPPCKNPDIPTAAVNFTTNIPYALNHTEILSTMCKFNTYRETQPPGGGFTVPIWPYEQSPNYLSYRHRICCTPQ